MSDFSKMAGALADGFSAFRELATEMSYERRQRSTDWDPGAFTMASYDFEKMEIDEPRSEGNEWDVSLAKKTEDEEEYADVADDEEALDPLLECDAEDFPGRKFYRFDDLHPDNGEFYAGKAIGIPYAVAVRTSNGQNRLIPLQIPGEEY